jgi:hypothetical protein
MGVGISLLLGEAVIVVVALLRKVKVFGVFSPATILGIAGLN